MNLLDTASFPDIPRLHTALAEWLACSIYIFAFKKRLGGVRLGFAMLAALAAQCALQALAGQLPTALWIPGMMAAIGLMFAYLYFCCDLSPVAVGYTCVRAFVLAEFAAALEWQLSFYRSARDGLQVNQLILPAVYASVFVVMYLLETRRVGGSKNMEVSARDLCLTVIMGLSVFFISNISFVYANTPFSSRFAQELFNARTLVNVGGLAILYAYDVQRGEIRMKYELDAIQNILQSQYAQYRQSRESIDSINRKYHDLKHQIAALRAETNPEKRNAFFDEMESEIKTYEAQNKTGNTVLDTVLTGKSLYCKKHNINLTCVADGTLLDFMNVMDICTIFGNALDNAIECEMQIPDQEKRLIHLSVFSKKDFLMMRFENYCEALLKFEDALPVTTKGNADYHGYGIKSIQYSVQKYGGSLTIHTQKNWFELKILIPIPPK